MRFVPNFTIRCQPLGRYRADVKPSILWARGGATRGGQSLGFRGEFCAGDRPWSRPKCRRFGGVGLSQPGSIGALRRQPKYNLPPFLFLVQGKILERQNRALSFPRIARGSRFLPTPGPQESEELIKHSLSNFPKKDLLARKSCFVLPQRPLPPSK
jgi:hypothetical protein